jgi:hypothetical protein
MPLTPTEALLSCLGSNRLLLCHDNPLVTVQGDVLTKHRKIFGKGLKGVNLSRLADALRHEEGVIADVGSAVNGDHARAQMPLDNSDDIGFVSAEDEGFIQLPIQSHAVSL